MSYPGEIMVSCLSELSIAGRTGATATGRAAPSWNRRSGCSTILDVRVTVGYVIGFFTLILIVANDTHDGWFGGTVG